VADSFFFTAINDRAPGELHSSLINRFFQFVLVDAHSPDPLQEPSKRLAEPGCRPVPTGHSLKTHAAKAREPAMPKSTHSLARQITPKNKPLKNLLI
jgi:hypothetical protein